MGRKEDSKVCVVICTLVAILFLNYSANALTLVRGMQYTLFGNDFFYVPGDVYSHEFFLNEDRHETYPSDIVGQILLDGDSGYNYEIRGGSIELTPAELLADQSYATSYPTSLFNPYIAQGLFSKEGVTLTISGYITTIGGAEILSDYGTLIEANVRADFYAVEQTYSASFLNFQLYFDITGGELFTGQQTGFALSPEFVSDITLRYCTQYGQSSLKNFTSDIGYAQPSIVQINAIGNEPVPEPATFVLFTITGLMIKRIRRNK